MQIKGIAGCSTSTARIIAATIGAHSGVRWHGAGVRRVLKRAQ